MITTDQLEALRVEIDKSAPSMEFTSLGHDWVDIWKQHHKYVLKREGIAIIENERLEYNAAGVK